MKDGGSLSNGGDICNMKFEICKISAPHRHVYGKL